MYVITYLILLLIGVVFGYELGNHNSNPYWIIPIAIVSAFLVLWVRNIYIITKSKNMKLVEKLLLKYRKRPYSAYLFEMLNGNSEKAKQQISKMTSAQRRCICLTNYYIQIEQLNLAKIENEKILDIGLRHYHLAWIAMMEDDQNLFELEIAHLKKPIHAFILEAEKAFRDGDFDRAETLAQLAVKNSAGLQRYMLLKSLENAKRNNHPNKSNYLFTYPI